MNKKDLVITEVKKLQPKQVVSYGYIGNQIGLTGYEIGLVLSALNPEECIDIPWHRVVRKDGYISSFKLGLKGSLQKQLLIDEGVEISLDNFVISPVLT